MKWVWILLLILLKEAGPTAACSSSCSWSLQYCYSSACCDCSSKGISSVPQDLPITIIELDLSNNYITTLSQSDFSRYSSLTRLELQYNQISVINSGAFYNLTRLTYLYLSHNRLTSLRSDMFVGLDSLRTLGLYHNNIHSIERGAFNATPQLSSLGLSNNQLTILRTDTFVGLDSLRVLYLEHNNIHSIETGAFNLPWLRTLKLSHNQLTSLRSDMFVGLDNLWYLYLEHNSITTFPESPSLLNIVTLWMDHNQMETLSSTAYEILASISFHVQIQNNSWQCDCRMLPFKQKMTGSHPFENQITCAGPANLTGKSLLRDVTPQDLGYEETTTDSEPLSESLHLISGFLGVAVGILLTLTVFLVIWCRKRKRKTGPAPAPDTPQDTTKNRDQACPDVTETGAAESDDVERALDPDPYNLDLGYRLVRPSLPPIAGTGHRQVMNMSASARGDDTSLCSSSTED